jgi:hypothetical protein
MPVWKAGGEPFACVEEPGLVGQMAVTQSRSFQFRNGIQPEPLHQGHFVDIAPRTVYRPNYPGSGAGTLLEKLRCGLAACWGRDLKPIIL